ncbi:hypothetical protein [Propionivibrio sp.]|uniref:hypothetical protein n=1 Tax=Propionivibrio sp. TaxID=2212460 RepID=UPI003BF12FE7
MVIFFVALHSASVPIRDIVLAKPNYSFEKRQRDLEKKRKQEEKRLRKLAEKTPADGDINEASSEAGVPSDADPASAGN